MEPRTPGLSHNPGSSLVDRSKIVAFDLFTQSYISGLSPKLMDSLVVKSVGRRGKDVH